MNTINAVKPFANLPDEYRCQCADEDHSAEPCGPAISAYMHDRAAQFAAWDDEYVSAILPAAESVWRASGFLPAAVAVRRAVHYAHNGASERDGAGVALTGSDHREDDDGARGALGVSACADSTGDPVAVLLATQERDARNLRARDAVCAILDRMGANGADAYAALRTLAESAQGAAMLSESDWSALAEEYADGATVETSATETPTGETDSERQKRSRSRKAARETVETVSTFAPESLRIAGKHRTFFADGTKARAFRAERRSVESHGDAVTVAD